MELWNTCNSLRYGFDENYDRPSYEDEEAIDETQDEDREEQV